MGKRRKASCHHTRLYSDWVLLREALSLDIDSASFEKVYGRIQMLNKKQIQNTLSICVRILKNDKIGWHRNHRILLSATQTIVAAAPHSVQIIEELIKNKSRSADYEIHSLLFCFLDSLIELYISKRLPRQILSYLKGYLLNIKRDKALAGWKAGESLGWHWPVEESLPVLMEAAKKARYVAGRESAFDGLGYVLAYGSVSPHCRRQILSLFKDTITNDKSDAVKHTAIHVLNFQAKGRKEINRLFHDIAKNNKNGETRELAKFALENPMRVFPPKKATCLSK